MFHDIVEFGVFRILGSGSSCCGNWSRYCTMRLYVTSIALPKIESRLGLCIYQARLTLHTVFYVDFAKPSQAGRQKGQFPNSLCYRLCLCP